MLPGDLIGHAALEWLVYSPSLWAEPPLNFAASGAVDS